MKQTSTNFQHKAAGTPLQRLVNYHANERQQDKADGISMLLGQQWCIVEFFELSDRVTYKVIGSDKEGKTVSAPVADFADRQFCGIVYYPEAVARQKASQLNKAWESRGAHFLAFNPYTNKF